MKRLSLRWKLTLATVALAGAAAAVLVEFAHRKTQNELLDQIERQLATKCEEVGTVLCLAGADFDPKIFVEVETRYSSTPHEFFYAFTDASGKMLLHSANLGDHGLGSGVPVDPPQPVLTTVPNPRDPSGRVRVRSERLPPNFELSGMPGPTLHVAVSLAPLERAARASLRMECLQAALALTILFWTVWTAVGRSLSRVAEIAHRASSITSRELRARLPLQGTGDELDELSSVLNGMLAGLEVSMEQMEAFTSDAAHQLRTPLTRLRCDVDLILGSGSELAPETRDRLEEMRGELERLAQTCGRLLLLARLDENAFEDALADDVDVSAVVEELVDQMGPVAAEKGVTLSSVLAGPASIRCVKVLLVEALLNLLDNALRVSSPGGVIRIAVATAGGAVMVNVSDQGPGVPEELREKIFRRFFRAGGSSEGTGLGLSIVRGIARAHGGDVQVGAASGGGATFTLSLPASAKPAPGARPDLRSAG